MPSQSDISRAEAELIRFLRKEWAEARRLGYPPMSAFAKDIARGTLAPAAQEAPDPIRDAVGRFYGRLRLIEKRVLWERYMFGRVGKGGAERVGLHRSNYTRTANRLIRRLSDYLVKHA